MAKNVVINGVTYQDVPEIDAPLAGENGVARFLDTTLGNGAAAAQIVNGYSAYVNGAKVDGSCTLVNVSQDSTTKVLTIS